LEEKALLAFDRLLQQVPGLPPDQIQATLSVCRQVEILPEDALRWVLEVAMLTRENQAARELLKDLLELVDHKLKKEGSGVLKKHTLIKVVRTLLFHHRNCYRFACDGHLAQFLAGVDEPTALDYYNNSIVGAVYDKLGQRIDIWKYGVRHLYKDMAGGHTVAPEFFQTSRGKRLPWIKQVLINSTEIYEEPGRGRFGKPNLAYVGQTIIGADEPKYTQYFLVLVESNRSRKLGFVTAFHVEEHKDLLKLLAAWTPREVKHAE
jgi:hypothetical protein